MPRKKETPSGVITLEVPGNGKRDVPIRGPEDLSPDVYNPDPKNFTKRLLVGTPTLGLVRMEWHTAFRGMLVPPNWSMVTYNQPLNTFIPYRYQVADAQNLIVRVALERDFEWLLFLEDDVLPSANFLVKLNQYMREGPPIVSGLYFTKASPSEPLIYRGRGTGSYYNWKMGDKVWADGVPTGALLIHSSILRAMWDESPEYIGMGMEGTREVFINPVRSWYAPNGDVSTISGTSDLEWCTRVMEGDYFRKAGWKKFARKRYPFLVDTDLFCKHIAPDGTIYPPGS